MSQITDDVQPETAFPLNLFGVLAIEMVENVQLVPALGLLTIVAHDDDVLEGVISLVVVESEHVDLHFLLMYCRDLSPILMMYLLFIHI